MKTRLLFITCAIALFGCNTGNTQQDLSTKTDTNTVENPGRVELISPDSLHKSPAFSQLAVVTGNVKTIYIGGQNAVDKNGQVVGKGDIGKQSLQSMKNVELALKASGAGIEHVVKWNIYFVKGQSAQDALKAVQPRLSKVKTPALVTGLFVEGLTNPDYLIEIEAVAIVPE